jgi:hypothetical protein
VTSLYGTNARGCEKLKNSRRRRRIRRRPDASYRCCRSSVAATEPYRLSPLPSSASFIAVRIGIRRGDGHSACRVRSSNTMAVVDDDSSEAPSVEQPEPPTPLGRYTGCPFNALICRDCGLAIGKKTIKLTSGWPALSCVGWQSSKAPWLSRRGIGAKADRW